MTCKAIRQGDQMCCGRCGLQWDLDDDGRPQCLTDDEIVQPVVEVPAPSQDVAKDALKELHHIVEDTKS